MDFVHPYYEQSGISAIIRNPVQPGNMFMFVDMLDMQVWMGILGSLIVATFTLWLLDKYGFFFQYVEPD